MINKPYGRRSWTYVRFDAAGRVTPDVGLPGTTIAGRLRLIARMLACCRNRRARGFVPLDEIPPDSGKPWSVGSSGDQDREAAAVENDRTMSMECTELGRDIESALGKVLAHGHGKTELPNRIVDDSPPA